jgi:isoleucyl-tRNA synthetase
MDRWILSELHSLIEKVEKAYENFDSQESGRLLAQFIDDLSNWYVRRSRRRFWDGDESALSTLYTSIKVLTQLLAPMVPFITEHVWQELVRIAEPGELESVHLAQFPVADKNRIDQKLSTSVALSRRLVELGRAARAESKIKIRQPLARALVSAKGWDSMDLEIRSHITDELNVLSMDELSTAGGDLVEISIKANFRTIGTRYGADVQAIAAAISGTDATSLVKKLRAEGKAKISYTKDGTEYQAEIDLDDLVVTETPKSGWSVSSHSGESVALDLELTPELIQAGLVREIIRAIQEERKNSGFDISDRIVVTWNGTAEAEKAIQSAVTLIGDEVLATSFNQDTSLAITDNEIGIALNLSKA